MKHILRRHIILFTVALMAASSLCAQNRRRINPVENPSTVTQSVNEARNDTARINEARRARSTHFHDDRGRIVYLDTVTGEQWMDSAALTPVIKMKYPFWDAASAGIDIWDPLMRAFGQRYGLAGAWVELSLHNRYKPVFEFGLGQASNTPSGNNYTYKSPLSAYFKLGANYNFLYNSTPDYQFFGGLRYGFSSFSYSINDITVDAPYWQETALFSIPSRRSTVGWFELVFGLRVKLWGPISAGWAFKYHKILHESSQPNGQPWYIPGYGSRSGAITGSFSVSYTISLDKLNKRRLDSVNTDEQTSADLDTPADNKAE